MAYGPATPLLQQAILTLLQGQKPSPLAPAPTAPPQDLAQLAQFVRRQRETAPIPLAPAQDPGPLNLETAGALAARFPEPVLPRFVQPAPADTSFVSQYAGPEPVAPPEQPNPLILRIARALQGYGAGVQGQGPQFLAQLQEQRERPQREYEARRERYEGRRTAGFELAERRAEREADRINRAAELQYERDYNVWLKKLGVRQGEADERTRQAFEIYKLDRQAKIEEARELRRERREREDEARHVSDQFFGLTKNKNLSDEIGKYRAGLSDKPLSPAATKLYNRVTQLGEAQMRRAFSVGSGSGSGVGGAVLKAAQAVEAAKGELMAIMERGGAMDEIKAVRKRIDKAVGNLRRFPGKAQGGLDASGFPWVKVWNGQQFVGIVPDGSAPAPAGSQRPDLQRFGIVPEQGMRFDLSGDDNVITLQELQELGRRRGETDINKLRKQAEAEGMIVR